MSTNKQINFEEEDRIIEEENKEYEQWLKEHLSKFDDLDKLFFEAKEIIGNYYTNQNEFISRENFKQFLKKQIEFYISIFKMPRKEKRKIRDKVESIEESYHELIYFGEFDPIEAWKNKLPEVVSSEMKDTSWKVKKII